MVQRVPAHLGETIHEPVSPWIVIAGVIMLAVVSCSVLLILLNIPERLKGLSVQAAPTATRTPRMVTPAVTILPATAAPPTATAGPTIATVKYKVKQGDTLSSISAKYRISVDAIKAANGLYNDLVRIGDELTIPLPTPTPPGGAQLQEPDTKTVALLPPISTPTTIAGQPTVAPPSPAVTPGMAKHTVVRGDTLISIAATYGSTVNGIMLANQLDSDMLSIGQTLWVPQGAWTPTVPPVVAAPPTATPTAQFAYAAPNLTWPPDGESLHGKEAAPRLEWTAPATLKQGEFFVIHIDYTVDGKPKSILQQVLQGTSYALKPESYPGANASGTEFKWYVVIQGQATSVSAAARADMKAPGVPKSQTSQVRTFIWY